jgi:hypothetical protein
MSSILPYRNCTAQILIWNTRQSKFLIREYGRRMSGLETGNIIPYRELNRIFMRKILNIRCITTLAVVVAYSKLQIEMQ